MNENLFRRLEIVKHFYPRRCWHWQRCCMIRRKKGYEKKLQHQPSTHTTEILNMIHHDHVVQFSSSLPTEEQLHQQLTNTTTVHHCHRSATNFSSSSIVQWRVINTIEWSSQKRNYPTKKFDRIRRKITIYYQQCRN